MQELFLQPGDVFVGDARYRVRTLLGSCVSMVFWQPRRRIGAMCHFMTPRRGAARGEVLEGRYGDEALELMLRALRAHGVVAGDCVVRLFGGASVLSAGTSCRAGGVGRRNTVAAHRLLAGHGLTAAAGSLSGVCHRRIRFDVSSGEVRMWKGQPSAEAGEQGACA